MEASQQLERARVSVNKKAGQRRATLLFRPLKLPVSIMEEAGLENVGRLLEISSVKKRIYIH